MSTPTAAVFTYLKTAIVVWVGTIFVVAGIGGTYSGVADWRAARRFEHEAVTAQAAIVAKSLERASRENDTSTRYLVTYRFTGSDGGPVEQTEQLPFDDWEPLTEGGTLEVRYVPGEPSTARMRAPDPWWVSLLVTGVTAVLAVIGFFIALPGWRRALMIWRLHDSGSTADGTIIEVAPTNVRINRVQQWRLRYEFRDEAGRTLKAESDLLSPGEATNWSVGQRGTVRYDRRRPSDNIWVGNV